MLVVSIVPLSLMAFLNITRVSGMEMRRYKTEVNSSLQWIEAMVAQDISDLRQKSIDASMEDSLIDLLANNSSITSQDNYELYKILYNLKLSTHCDSAAIIGRNGTFSSTSSSQEMSQLMFAQYNQYRDTLKHTKPVSYTHLGVLSRCRYNRLLLTEYNKSRFLRNACGIPAPYLFPWSPLHKAHSYHAFLSLPEVFSESSILCRPPGFLL